MEFLTTCFGNPRILINSMEFLIICFDYLGILHSFIEFLIICFGNHWILCNIMEDTLWCFIDFPFEFHWFHTGPWFLLAFSVFHWCSSSLSPNETSWYVLSSMCTFLFNAFLNNNCYLHCNVGFVRWSLFCEGRFMNSIVLQKIHDIQLMNFELISLTICYRYPSMHSIQFLAKY